MLSFSRSSTGRHDHCMRHRGLSDQLRWLLYVSAVAGAASSACGGQDAGGEAQAVQDADGEVQARQDALYVENVPLFYDNVPPNRVDICFNGILVPTAFAANGIPIEPTPSVNWADSLTLPDGHTYQQIKDLVVQTLNQQWGSASGLYFVQHNDCSQMTTNWVPVRLVVADYAYARDQMGNKIPDNHGGFLVNPPGFGGQAVPGMGARLGPQLDRNGQNRVAQFWAAVPVDVLSNGPRSDFKSTVVHEMGHSLGWIHEHQRPEDASSVAGALRSDLCQGEVDRFNAGFAPGDRVIRTDGWGATYYYDPVSVMNYCRVPNGGPADETLSYGDKLGAAAVYGFSGSAVSSFCSGYGDRLYVGHFNEDNVGDYLCNSRVNGNMTVAFGETVNNIGTPSANRYTLSAHGYCSRTSEALYVADANGDGQDDLICNRSDGLLYVDLAEAGGRFDTIDWSRRRNFCQGGTGQMVVGDFNGDHRADLLCTDQSGVTNVDFADSSGRYLGDEWSVADSGFCSDSAAETLLAGDVDGNGTDDLICYNTSNRKTYVNLTNATDADAGLATIDWSAKTSYCQSGTLVALHLNQDDTRIDLACRDNDSGYIKLMFSTGTHYGYIHAQGPFGRWMAGNCEKLLTADMNHDGRSEIVCQHYGSMSTAGATAVVFGNLPSGG